MDTTMNRLILSVLLLAFCAPPASADLRYTTRVEVRRASTDVASPDAAVMNTLLQTLMPPGETRTFIGGGAIRIEQMAASPRSIVLMRPDGQVILYPESGTYFRIPASAGLFTNSRLTADTAFHRTGEFVTMLGVQAERILVTLKIVLPALPPAGFPTRVTFEGEVWVADVHREEALGIQQALGFSVVPDGVEGMVLRQVLRSAEFGYEVESTVVELVDGPIPPDMFVVPPGFRELNQPVAPAAVPGGSRRK
jgi:hypothetical protein